MYASTVLAHASIALELVAGVERGRGRNGTGDLGAFREGLDV